MPGDQVLTWANGITLLRFLALPVFIYLITERAAYGAALVLLWVLAAMDVLDGYLARRLNQVSRIGTWIDPITDRAAILCLVVALLIAHLIPWWLAAVIALREAALGIVVGVVSRGTMPIPVTRTGKIATLSLLIGLPGYLLPGVALVHAGAVTLATIGVALYYVSLFQYTRAAFRRPGAPSRSARAARLPEARRGPFRGNE